MPILPDSELTIAYRTLVRRIRNEVPAIKTLRSWDGNTASDDEPSTSNCPWVKITPVIDSVERLDSIGSLTTSRYILRLIVETAVAGYIWDDSANLWRRIEKAMQPQVEATRLTIDDSDRDAGIDDVIVARPALPAGPGDMTAGLIRGTGEVLVYVAVGT